MDILHEEEAPHSEECRCGHAGEYQCQDCSNTLLWCKECCLRSHQFLPTHRISQYTSGGWEKSSLAEIGHIWYLGHNGLPCQQQPNETVGTWVEDPVADEMDIDSGTKHSTACEESYTQIMVVDTNGIVLHNFHFCTCTNAESEVDQLCRAHLFPSSYNRIQTVFTFRVLDEYLVDSTECKTSGNAFWSKLQSRTEFAFPEEVPVRDTIFAVYHCI